MKKFIYKIALFTLLFFLLDKAFLYVRNVGPELEVDKRLEYIINGEINADLLIFGSSRGARSVIASQITEKTGVSAYNLSYPGSDITFHEFLLRLLLQQPGNRVPETIVLVVDDGDELRPSKNLKFRLDRMYPVVKYKVIRDEMVRRKEQKYIVNELLILAQLNKSNFLLKQKKFTKNDSIMPCGSMPISHQKKTFNKKYGEKPYTYERKGELIQKIRAFRKFVRMCHENSIELIIAIPPNFRKTSIGFKARMEQMVGKYGTVIEFDSTNPIYSNPDYFFDNAHLQRNGSVIYTDEIIDYYKKMHQLD